MASGPVIIVCPTLQIVIGTTRLETYTAYDTMMHATGVQKDSTPIHTTKNVDTMVHDRMLHGIKKDTATTDTAKDGTMIDAALLHSTKDTAHDTITHVLNDIVDTADISEDQTTACVQKDTTVLDVKKKKYVEKKRPCPIPGCKRNNQPLLLYMHLRCVHKLCKKEMTYWLKKQ